jgi:transcriptional regulator with XRE-family HTH domain
VDADAVAARRRQVGEVLRQRRLELDWDIDRVCEDTKLSPAYLDALERGDYDAMPSRFWAEQFLRSYAKSLGLPTEELVATAFAEERAASRRTAAAAHGEAAPTLSRRAARRGRRDPSLRAATGAAVRRRDRQTFWGPYVITPLTAVVAAAAVVIVVLYLVHQPAPHRQAAGTGTSHRTGTGGRKGGHPGGKTHPSGGTRGGTPPSTGSQRGKKSGTSHPTATTGALTRVATSSGVNTYRVAHGPISATLRVAWPTWVRVVANGRQTLVHLENTGFTATFSASRSLNIYLGYPKDSSLTVNGTKLGPFTGTGTQWLDFTTR